MKLVLILGLVVGRLLFGAGDSSVIILDSLDPMEAPYAWRSADCRLKNDILKIQMGAKEKGNGKLTITLEDFTKRMSSHATEEGQLDIRGVDQNERMDEQYPVVFIDRDGEIRGLAPTKHPMAGCQFHVFDVKMSQASEIESLRLALSCQVLVGLNSKSWAHRSIQISKKYPIVCRFPNEN